MGWYRGGLDLVFAGGLYSGDFCPVHRTFIV